MKDYKPNQKDQLKAYAKYTSIAFQMLVVILLGVFGGIKLDQILKLEFPIFTILLSILSVILSIYYVTKDLLKKNQK